MTAPARAVDADPLARLQREVERTMLRTRNGLRLLGGERFVRTGPSLKDVVWRARKAELWRYRPLAPLAWRTPVLLYIGLVSRSYVVDLHEGNSLVERLLRAGFDVFVLDWGVPDEADAGNGLDVYALELLPRAIRATLRASGGREVNLMAYCMGGCLTLMMMGARGDLPIRSLLTMATPVDYRRMGEFYQPLVEGRVDAAKVVDETGNVPAGTIHGTVRVRRPTGDLVQYANLWEHLWNEDWLEGFQSMREWVADHIPFPGAAFRDVYREWLVGNGFMAGTLTFGGRRVDLGLIACPTLCLVAEHDEMVPLAAASPLPALLTGVRARTEVIRSGHVSLVCGRGMERKTLPVMLEWLRSNADPVGGSPTLGEGEAG